MLETNNLLTQQLTEQIHLWVDIIEESLLKCLNSLGTVWAFYVIIETLNLCN